jgi:hypothetical protein
VRALACFVCLVSLSGCSLASHAVDAASGPDLGEVPPECAPLPASENYDYRPAEPPVEPESRVEQAPPWYVLAELHSTQGSSVRKVQESWKRTSPANRAEQAAGIRWRRADIWAQEAALGKPVFVPRHVSTADVTADEPPSWAKSLAGEKENWSSAPYTNRQAALEGEAVDLALKADAEWDRVHTKEIEAWKAERAAKAKKDYDDKIAKKLAGPIEDARLADIAGDPARFAKRTLRVEAQWIESVGRGSHLDDLGGNAVLIIGLSPASKRQPQVMFALDLGEYEKRITFFEGLEPKSAIDLGTRVEAILYVLGPPLDRELPCVGRILRVVPK